MGIASPTSLLNFLGLLAQGREVDHRAADKGNGAAAVGDGDEGEHPIARMQSAHELVILPARTPRLGWDAVVVVNEERVVFGLLRAKELALDGDQLIAQAMRPGPSTFRPYVLAEEMAHSMVEHNLDSSPITTSDGRLVGLLLQKDVVGVAGSVQ